MTFTAVIFDLDGTLLDTLEDLHETLDTLLARHALPRHSIATTRQLIGRGIRELVRNALPPDQADPETVDRLLPEFMALYAEGWNRHTKPYPGIPELLDQLGQSSLKLAILSNKADHFTQLCAGTLLASWRFDAVLGNHHGIPPKPDPEGALLLARMLGESPASILYIGDSGVDMLTATRAGMYPLGVLWGFRSADELRNNGAAALVTTPAEIAAILAQSTRQP